MADLKKVDEIFTPTGTGVIPPGCLFAYCGSSAPDGYLLADGSAVSRTAYAALFAIIGTAYGIGDGATTFNLPDHRGRFGLGKADSGTGSALGDIGGALDHTHTGGSHNHGLGSHSHTVPSHYHGFSLAVPTYNVADRTVSNGIVEISHGHSDNFSVLSGGPILSHSASVTGGSHRHQVRVATGVGGSTSQLTNGDWVTTGNNFGVNWYSDYDGGHTHSVSIDAHNASHGHTLAGAVTSLSTTNRSLTGASVNVDHTHGAITGTVGDSGGSNGNSTMTSGDSTGNTDSGGAVATSSNNPPFLVVNYIIKV